jgi:hypothetical protein
MTGTCYGYEVRSPLPLAYLRNGRGGDPLAIEMLTRAPDADEVVLEFERPARLHRSGDGFALWVGEVGWYGVDPAAPSIGVPADADELRREERLWGVPALLCFRARGDLPLHAAAVEVDGRAILLAAPGRFGKTTLAAGFAAAGHRLLSEDLSCLRLGEDGASVFPGPALLRVREDVAGGLELAGEVRGDRDGRIHVALDEAARGDGAPVPVRAIVLVAGTAGEIALQRVDPAVATRDLWALTFRLANDEDRARSFAQVAKLAATTPVLTLERPLGLEHLRRTVEAIAAHA